MANNNIQDDSDLEEELIPWQKTGIRIIREYDQASGRYIYWIYSIMGEMGKTYFVKMVIEEYDALLIENAKPSDIKHIIKNKKEKSEEDKSAFSTEPIILIDMARTDAQTVDKPSFYTLLEGICGSFTSTKYEGGSVTWDTPPCIMIFANFRPNPFMMSPDRIQTYIISNETLDLVRDTVVDAQLEEMRQTLEQEQADRESEIEGTMAPALTDTETKFRLCYERTADGPSISSKHMHFRLKHKGYNGTQKAMNSWIRDFYASDIANGDVIETRNGNVHGWKGFKQVGSI